MDRRRLLSVTALPSRGLARRIMGAAVAAALAVGLVACAGEPEPTPTPTPDANAPVFESDEAAFESDEAAFAAAEDAYADYVAAAGAVYGDGGQDAQRLEEVASGQALELGLATSESFREDRERLTGAIVPVFEPLQYSEDPERGAVIRLQVCEDISGTDVVDESGASQVAEGRTEIIPYQAIVEGTSAASLKVSERLLGRGSCG